MPDYNGIWCELGQLYWSQQSMCLISRHPLSSTEEVISLYCPQCLARYSEDEAVSSGGCCSNCVCCPACRAILAPLSSSGVLSCTQCAWTRKHVTNDNSVAVKATGFQALLDNIAEGLPGPSARPATAEKHRGVWQMEELQAKLATIVDTDAQREAAILTKLKSMTSEVGQNCAPGMSIPIKVKLLSKRSLRSRQDNRSGRMNILVQPKTLPLEGDSSLKLQKGKWWVKDASAVHEVPFVSILSLPTATELTDGQTHCAVQLSITNPKMSEVVITFIASGGEDSQQGEHFHWLSVLGSTCTARAKQRLQHSTLLQDTTATPDRAGQETLRLVLGGYEDELLRDTEGNEGQAEAECGPTIDTSRSAGSGEYALHSRPWRYTVKHNRAVVKIPVSLADSPAVGCTVGNVVSNFVLHLDCAVDLGGGSIVKYPFRVLF